MGAALKIWEDIPAEELRRLARRERDGRVSSCMVGIANALYGLSRAETARLTGDGAVGIARYGGPYNAEGLAGLRDRPKGHRARRFSEDEEATLAAAILRGPDPERDGTCVWWTRADLCDRMKKHCHRTAETRQRGSGCSAPRVPSG